MAGPRSLGMPPPLGCQDRPRANLPKPEVARIAGLLSVPAYTHQRAQSSRHSRKKHSWQEVAMHRRVPRGRCHPLCFENLPRSLFPKSPITWVQKMGQWLQFSHTDIDSSWRRPDSSRTRSLAGGPRASKDARASQGAAFPPPHGWGQEPSGHWLIVTR